MALPVHETSIYSIKHDPNISSKIILLTAGKRYTRYGSSTKSLLKKYIYPLCVCLKGKVKGGGGGGRESIKNIHKNNLCTVMHIRPTIPHGNAPSPGYIMFCAKW